MKASLKFLATALTAGALALPGAAMAQGAGGGAGGGNATGGANPGIGTLPSQRYAVTGNQGQGAVLTIDASGVREVQQALNRLGYNAGPLSGNWDRPTQQAMAHFQAAHGLVPNGNLTVSAIAALGLWPRLIGSPTGSGHQGMVAQNATGAPPPRGQNGGNGGALGGAGGGAGGAGGNMSRTGGR